MLNFKERQYVTDTANRDPVNYESPRRSVYLPVVRSALYEVYTAFDFGDPTVMNGDRSSTTVAPQALFVMNSSIVLSQTAKLASELTGNGKLSDQQRVTLLYERCLNRSARPDELKQALAFVDHIFSALATREVDPVKRKLKAWQSLCKTVIATNEFIVVE